jgi:hypothetical protein
MWDSGLGDCKGGEESCECSAIEDHVRDAQRRILEIVLDGQGKCSRYRLLLALRYHSSYVLSIIHVNGTQHSASPSHCMWLNFSLAISVVIEHEHELSVGHRLHIAVKVGQALLVRPASVSIVGSICDASLPIGTRGGSLYDQDARDPVWERRAVECDVREWFPSIPLVDIDVLCSSCKCPLARHA